MPSFDSAKPATNFRVLAAAQSTGTSAPIVWPGGQGVFAATAAGTVLFEFSPDDNVTWITYSSHTTKTFQLFELPACLIRVTNSSGTVTAWVGTNFYRIQDRS